jgi:short-subunit dehydrogenase
MGARSRSRSGRSPALWRRALVTGASSGIGLAFVEALAQRDVAVTAVARRGDRLEELARRFSGVEPLVADLSTAAGLAAVSARLADRTAGPDLLVNNAGFAINGRFADLALAEHRSQIEVNVTAVVTLTHAALGPMRQAGRGWVLNVSSVAGFAPAPGAAAYAATKAFVTSFSEALAEEVRPDGVVVCALCPGLTRSEFHQRAASHGATAGVAHGAPAWAWMQAGDVVEAGLRGLAAGRVVVVPGPLNRTLVGAARITPSRLRRRVAAFVRARPPARSAG